MNFKKSNWLAWILFFLLSLIWGSSFMLMKIGLESFSAYQVASIRILSAGLVLSPFLWKAWKAIPSEKRGTVILSGWLGSFFPAFLFCIAETRIDSSLAAILNSLTPLSTILLGVAFFQLAASKEKWLGVIIGLIGLLVLILPSGSGMSNSSLPYALLVLLATVLYALNVNMVGRKLQGIGSLEIASLAFSMLTPAAFLVLLNTNFFNIPTTGINYWKSFIAASTLGIIGTAFASILFYMLLKKSGPLFASMVTYGIPFVAVILGWLGGESIGLLQMGALFLILGGVYLANKK
ncbi:MAG: DMT family transporter [Hydrotalea sp.]|nr:DMT family transporter [Hydrotalea sp.]